MLSTKPQIIDLPQPLPEPEPGPDPSCLPIAQHILMFSLSFSPSLSLAARIQREPLPHRKTSPAVELRAGPERGTDQDLVPEQTRQDQEVDGLEEPPRPAADGPRVVQPYNGAAHQRGGGARDAHERADTVSSSAQ